MELSGTTFVLEIINFLVLVWILKRFLYRPVLDVIARRRASVAKTMADAETLHARAEKLQEQYEGRLAAWENEREEARRDLDQEFETVRKRKMEELQAAIEREHEKVRAADARRRIEAVREMETAALGQGARFATRLLEQASGPEVQNSLVHMLVTELSGLSDERIRALRNSFGKAPQSIRVLSAFPLAADQRQKLERLLSAISESDAGIYFEQDSELLAGVRITIGAWILAANIRDELQGFVELARYE